LRSEAEYLRGDEDSTRVTNFNAHKFSGLLKNETNSLGILGLKVPKPSKTQS